MNKTILLGESDNMTVGALRTFLADIPDDVPVYIDDQDEDYPFHQGVVGAMFEVGNIRTRVVLTSETKNGIS